MHRLTLAVALPGACGRLSFDAATDASGIDATTGDGQQEVDVCSLSTTLLCEDFESGLHHSQRR